MAAPSDDVPSSSRLAGRSWASTASAALANVESWPTAARRLVSELPVGVIPALELRLRTGGGGFTAAEPPSLPAGIGSRRLGLTEWTIGSSAVVSVTGEVDIATTDQLSEALGTALRRGPKGLVCDLRGVGFLGAAGLTVLLVARRRAIAGHAWFDVVCPQPLHRKVIALVGLDAVFCLHDRVAEAVDAQARYVDRPGLTTASGPR